MGWLTRLYRGENEIDFTSWWRWGIPLSLALVVISLLSLVLGGLKLGIEFEGGTSWEVVAPDVSVSDARDAVRPFGAAEATIQTIGDDTIRVRSEIDDPATVSDITAALAELAGAEVNDVTVQTVGPSWGDQVTNKARTALIWFFIVLALYITWQLEWRMAVGALVAVVHDIILSVGVYSVFNLEVTPATVVAFLTILGYSLYDTIVVYDKVHEITARVGASGRYTYTEMMNLSLNQVLMRSVNTTFTAILPVIAMLVIGSLILGGSTLQEFGVALLVGLLSGAYSSVFVAAPVVAWLKERQPSHQEARRKITARAGGETGVRTVSRDDVTLGVAGQRARAAMGGRGGGSSAPGASTGSAPAATGAIPPRPRKKKR